MRLFICPFFGKLTLNQLKFNQESISNKDTLPSEIGEMLDVICVPPQKFNMLQNAHFSSDWVIFKRYVVDIYANLNEKAHFWGAKGTFGTSGRKF